MIAPDEVAEVVVVPGAVGAGPGLPGQHHREPVEHLVEHLLVGRLVQDLHHAAQLGDVGLQVGTALGEQVGELRGERGEVGDRGTDRLAVAGRRCPSQFFSSTMSSLSWSCRSSTVWSIAERLSMTSPISWSRSASVLVSEAVWLISCPIGAALTLEHLDEVQGELVDLGRLQGLEERLEAVEQLGQVQRRLWSARPGWCRRRAASPHPAPPRPATCSGRRPG